MISKMMLVIKKSLASAGDKRDMNLIPGSGRSPSVGNDNGYLLQYTCLENSMGRGVGLQSKGLQRVRHD